MTCPIIIALVTLLLGHPPIGSKEQEKIHLPKGNGTIQTTLFP